MQLALFPTKERSAAPLGFDQVWFWYSRMGERNRKGLRCRVLIRGGRNSVLVEMEDGEKVITSRYAVRKAE
jgi:hypothetical protein